jgi:hypothetical protein
VTTFAGPLGLRGSVGQRISGGPPRSPPVSSSLQATFRCMQFSASNRYETPRQSCLGCGRNRDGRTIRCSSTLPVLTVVVTYGFTPRPEWKPRKVDLVIVIMSSAAQIASLPTGCSTVQPEECTRLRGVPRQADSVC